VQNSILNRLVIFSDQVAHQKMALHPEILIFPDYFAKHPASGFAILPELSLKAVELDVELNSASNDAIFTRVIGEKISVRARAEGHRRVNAIVRVKRFCSMTLGENSIIRRRI
jgi:hypothetical protein